MALGRQHPLRADAEQGDLQVIRVDQHHRGAESHPTAQRQRVTLKKIAAAHDVGVKAVEVPPGTPVMSDTAGTLDSPRFIELLVAQGTAFNVAVMRSAAVRAQPIALTRVVIPVLSFRRLRGLHAEAA